MRRLATATATVLGSLAFAAPAEAHLGNYCGHGKHSHVFGLYSAKFVQHFNVPSSPFTFDHLHVIEVDAPALRPQRHTIRCRSGISRVRRGPRR